MAFPWKISDQVAEGDALPCDDGCGVTTMSIDSASEFSSVRSESTTLINGGGMTNLLFSNRKLFVGRVPTKAAFSCESAETPANAAGEFWATSVMTSGASASQDIPKGTSGEDLTRVNWCSARLYPACRSTVPRT